MQRVFYVTHPQVEIDPAVPVPQWGLSALGRQRIAAAASRDWARGLGLVASSTERKALDGALVLAAASTCPMLEREDLGENDRSATGFLPPPEFEATADLFFAHPETSIRGWERAVDAQRRIVAAVGAVLADAPRGRDIAIVGHGGVGTLLLCHLKGLPIARSHDQTLGGGSVFAFDRTTSRVLHGWRALEDERIGDPE